MADISKLSRLVNGVQRQVDLSANTLVVDQVKVGGGAGTNLTKTILDNLITLQNGSDISASLHHHDGRYFTETELGSTGGTSGADLIGTNNTPSNYSPSAATVQDHLEAIDTALASAGGTEFSDAVFRIKDDIDATKKIAFQADQITTGNTKTIIMPDFNVNLGALENVSISATAAIDFSKMASLTADRAIISNGSGVITASSVTATELGYVSGVTSSIQTQLNAKAADGDVIKKDGSVAFTAAQSMGGFKLTNLAAPTASSDAVTKAYVDSSLEGLKPKAAVRAATTAAGTLASDFENGDTIDGVNLATGDRILIKDQAVATENGIYIVAASGAPTRASDFDSLSPIDEINGAIVAVQEGTANAGKIFVQSGEVGTIGTDPISFVFFNSVAGLIGGDGITVSGSTISIDHDGEGLQFSANQLALELDGSTLSKGASGLKVATGGINDNEINASAAISLSKLAALTADRAIISNGSGILSASSVTSTELGYVSGVTSAIQTQLNAKAADADVIKKDGSVAFTAAQSMGGFKLTNLAAPTASSDAVTKAYADALVAVDSFKVNVTLGFNLLTTNQSKVVRYAVDGETAGRVYGADSDASSSDLFHVVGIVKTGAAGLNAGDTISMTVSGVHTFGSNDTMNYGNFAAADVGKPLWLDGSTAGRWSVTAPTASNRAAVMIGVVLSTTSIWVAPKIGMVN